MGDSTNHREPRASSAFVDTQEHIDRLLPILDEMVTEGFVTLERARVLKSSPGQRPIDPGAGDRK